MSKDQENKTGRQRQFILHDDGTWEEMNGDGYLGGAKCFVAVPQSEQLPGGLVPSGFWALDTTVGPPVGGDTPIQVERTGVLNDLTADCWAIRHFGYCYGRDGSWDHEPLPSSRTDQWLANYRWTLAEACTILDSNHEGEKKDEL